MGPRERNESWVDWRARMRERAQRSAQKSVLREEILAMMEAPKPFIAWLQGVAPDAEVASIYTPTNSILAEYLWAKLEVYAMSADSVVWEGGIIEWEEIPAWVRSLNHTEALRMQAVPDDKDTWTASEVLAMVYEATSSGR